MQEDFFIRTILVLVADEFERAIHRLDGAFQLSLGIAPAQLQLVDVTLDFLESQLRLLQEEVGPPLRLPDDQLGLGLRRVKSIPAG